jgi:hypothetical protein
MSFGLITQYPNRMLTYEQALTKYHSIKPIRGRSDQNTRPLANRRNDTITIRMDGDKVIVRHWSTDIIVYHPDGTIVGEPYPSVTTKQLVSSILSPMISPHWSNASNNCFTEVQGQFFSTPNYYELKDGLLVGGSKPIRIPSIDRKLAKEACAEYNLPAFSQWLKTLVRIGTDPRGSYHHHITLTLLADQADWPAFAQQLSHADTIEASLARVRSDIYRNTNVIKEEIVPYLDGWRQHSLYVQAIRRHYYY